MTYSKFEDDAAVVAFVRAHTDQFTADEPLHVEEIGDGNINYIYRVKGNEGSVIVKQALPYIRIIGTDWPLSIDRIRIEAQVLQTEAMWAPNFVPKMYAFSAEESAFAMEDIGDHENLRFAFIERHPLPSLGEHLGLFLAETLFHTSDFYLDYETKKRAVANYINPGLCKITEDLFFCDPYCDHERNSISPPVLEAAQGLWNDKALKIEVTKLKRQFMNCPEALVHGDLHAGSVFVRADSTKVIDPEFAFYGPMAFDIGSIIGNVLLNYAGQFGLAGPKNERDDYQAFLLGEIVNCWSVFHKRFTDLVAEKSDEPTMSQPDYVQAFLADVWCETVGFAGTEVIRRTIGLAHIADIDSIDDIELRAKSERWALALGREMIVNRHSISSPDALNAIALALPY
ncbi:S-methyl-5-thioribose kinase [Neptunomonas phycophila]|uniref:S-methyl-5-thioribose kinase n=1 Tax=Neptunomonas phycophila TaxID=1572645 RepID=UPI001BE90CDA|nr:S-methyl-5-thioribose kinase [Neptunomonas phycophila]MBT3146372.1 S-methyl-5-thioribose kinase [Neptunomonas phycophila]